MIAAREELGRTETALEQRTAALLAAQVAIRELERQQAEEAATRKALEAEIKRLGEEAVARERELEKVRHTFSRDLEKLRETADRAEERLRASEKRALLEIDRERSAVAKAQRELAEAGKRADKREAEHRRTVEALQEQQGDARHQTGVLQGRLTALEAAHKSLQEQLKSLRGTTRPPTRRVSTSESSPPVRRAARKAAVGKTARAKART
jgi:chromosome segregation ATPase